MWATRLLLLAGACAVASALPTSNCLDEDHMCQMKEAVLTIAEADESLRQQLADTLAAVKESQTGIREFLELAANTTKQNSVAGGSSDLTSELQTLNQLFRNYLLKLSCPAPYHLLGNECFSFILEDMTWEAARQKCLELGADLAMPEDVTRLRLYIMNRYPRKNSRNFWIGGHSENKVWEWLNGDPINDQYWYTNEPSGNGECLAMFDGWENPFTDFPCERERRAVCQRPMGK